MANQKGELVIHAMENIDENAEDSNYRPEIYFSTAQLNTVAFSSFFSRALQKYRMSGWILLHYAGVEKHITMIL